jgi:hypothetical protein
MLRISACALCTDRALNCFCWCCTGARAFSTTGAGAFCTGLARLVTLQDAGTYITKLPKAEHEAAEWQAALEALILVAELGGPMMFARIGIMRALNRYVERVFNPDRKEHRLGRRKLAR